MGTSLLHAVLGSQCCLSSCIEHAPGFRYLHPAGIMVSGCFSPEGGLWMWGANTNSQLGKGDEEEDELVPLKVQGSCNLWLMVFPGLGSLPPSASVLRTYAANAASIAVRQLAAVATAQAAHARQQLHMSLPMPQECLLPRWLQPPQRSATCLNPVALQS